MSEALVITEELNNLVGVESGLQIFEAENVSIRRFAQAVGELNPIWQDKP